VMVMVMACVRDYDLWRLPVITKGETKNDCIQQKTRFLLRNYGHIQIAITVFVLTLTVSKGLSIHDRRGYALEALSDVFLTEHQGCVCPWRKNLQTYK
jgi:hypothetical protein